MDVGGGKLGEERGVERWCGAVEGLCGSSAVDTGVGVGIVFA